MSSGILACSECGLRQRGGASTDAHCICSRCRSPTHPCRGLSLDVPLAGAVATVLLLVPTLFETFLTTYAFGETRSSTLLSSASAMWQEGWPILSIVVDLCVIAFPLLRFGSLAVILGALRLGARPRWAGHLFRQVNALETWAMLDVFLLGLAVAYVRLRTSIEVTLDSGGICFTAAAVMSVVVRGTLDKTRVWQLIGVDPVPGHSGSSISCHACGLFIPPAFESERCPRCRAVLCSRRPGGVLSSIALLIAALLLYFPANFYPIATIPIDLKATAYTVLGGVIDLYQAGFISLALLVLTASFAIPLLKMAGLSWCTVSVLRRSKKRLVAKTRLYRWLDEIGRWSLVDPFTIACFVPVMHFNSLIYARAEAAATPFAVVVILTTLAVKLFDPRRLWDSLENAT